MLNVEKFEELLDLMTSTAKSELDRQITGNVTAMGKETYKNYGRTMLVGTSGQSPLETLKYAVDSLRDQQNEIDEMEIALRAAYRVLQAARGVE